MPVLVLGPAPLPLTLEIERFEKVARVTVGRHVLTVRDIGEPWWPDWWLMAGRQKLRRVRGLEHGITTARATLAGWLWADGAPVPGVGA